MKMSVFSSLRRLQVTYKRFSIVRTYLSDAYKCQDAWQNRLQSPLLSKLNLDEFYYGLEQKFNHTGVISGIDVDIFTLGVQDESRLDELEDLVYKLRQSANAAELLPSTGHNLVRFLHHTGHTSELLRILHDRLNYGIFVDHHSSNLVMDQLLKDGRFEEAAKVGVLHGLQEDTDNKISNNLALLACLRNVLEGRTWELESPPKEEEPAEEVKIRVQFLRNPYFDNQFDLVQGEPLMGRTMAVIAPTLEDRTLADSLELLGWALLGDWAKVERKAKSLQGPVFKESFEIIQKQISKANEGETKIQAGVDDALSKVKTIEGSLLESMEGSLKNTVAAQETKDIVEQQKRYETWEQLRQEKLASQLRENEVKQRLQAIEEKKKYIEEKEQLLSFFEKEDKYNLMIEDLEAEEEKQKLETFHAPTEETDTYVPPEVVKRHGKTVK